VNVDEIVDHTSDYCSCCGYDISANVVTLVFRRGRRSGKVLEDMFGDALKNMTAVTDRHSAYFALNFISLQICLSHILREVQYLNESDDKQQWPVELQTLLREAIHHRNQNPDKVIDSSVWLLQLDNILKQNVAHLKDDFRRLKNGLIKYRDYIFKFLEDPAIPPDNNASEPGIRKLKIKQKISGTFRPDQGADAFMAIHSIADTAWKNRQAPFQPILEVMQNTSNSFAGRVCQKSTPSLFIQKVRTFPSSDFFISQRYRIFRHTIFHYAKVTI
jgi:hypothetical protein